MPNFDFRREHQAAWAQQECQRLREAFGDAISVELHLSASEFVRGDRVMTITDPEGEGVPLAVCFTEQSAEGGFWRVDVLPVDSTAGDVPRTRSLHQVALEMRYGKCVFATWDASVGRPSGDGGWPDTGDGVEKALRGGVRVQRRLSVSAQSPSRPYARLASERAS